MGYIHCCGGLHKTKTFVLVPDANYSISELDYLAKCPVCQNLVIQLTRVDDSKNISVIRYTKDKAEKFWIKIKNKILYEEKNYSYPKYRGRDFYLYYNEFGIKKRCYSNLKNMKLGLRSYD